MNKYAPLRRWLEGRAEPQIRVSFAELETILGFALPRSARQHRPWWANSFGSHVQAEAWLDAGWQTAQVDLEAQTLVFVRLADPAYPIPPASVSGVEESSTAVFIVRREALTPAAQLLVEDCARDHQVDAGKAIAFVLNAAAQERRRKLLDEFAARSPKIDTSDIVDLIHEGRNGRGIGD